MSAKSTIFAHIFEQNLADYSKHCELFQNEKYRNMENPDGYVIRTDRYMIEDPIFRHWIEERQTLFDYFFILDVSTASWFLAL